MDSATVGVVCFAFAIGFSFTEVLFRRRRRGLRYAMAMFLSIAFVLGFTRYVVQPYFQSTFETTPVVRFSQSSQLLAAIQRLEPAMSFGSGAGAAASPADLRRRSVSTMTRHVWRSSDDAITEFAKTLVGNAEALERQDASICVSYLFAASDGEAVDYARYLDERAMKNDLTAIAVALESAARSTGAVSTVGDRERGMRTLRNRLSDRYTAADFERFERRRSLSGSDGAFACRMAIDLYREALTLPPSQRAAVLRNLIAR